MIETTGWVLGNVLARQAVSKPDVVIIETTDGRRATIREMNDSSNRLGNALRELGVAFGDHVTVVLENGMEFIQSWFAISRIGAVLVPVNPVYRGDFLKHILVDSSAKVAIVSPEMATLLVEIQDELKDLEIVVVVGEKPSFANSRFAFVEFSDLHRGSPDEIEVTATVRDPAMIIYTSGTTGPSKGVVLPYGSGYMNAHIYITQMGLTEQDRIYCCLPLFHANALETQIYAGLILGSPILLAPVFSASKWLSDIRRFGATVTNMMGAMTEFIYRQPPSPDDVDNPLRIACAVPIPLALGEAFERRFDVRLVELYGTTECKISHCMPAKEGLRPGSCGRVVEDFFECRLVDGETEAEVPIGVPGEALLRPRVPWTVLLGYHGQPAATAKAWQNLWFHTGDVLRRDADGYYYFVDRRKDAIRRRGENISSFEVERTLLQHGAVAEVAVIGVPSPFVEGDQEVMAVIVARSGVVLDFEEVEAFCESRLPYFAVPRFCEVVAEIPKTPSHRVRKDELRRRGIRAETWRSARAAWGRRKLEAAAQASSAHKPTASGSPSEESTHYER